MKNYLYIPIIASFFLLFSCTEEENNELKAEFKISTGNVLSGQSIDFLDLTEGQPSSWQWTFAGGTPETSDLSCPTVIYNQPGTYSVTLVVTNSGGSSQIVKENLITVEYNTITVDFEADKVNALETDLIRFTDKTVGLPTSWQWTFMPQTGSPVTSSEQNPKLSLEEGIYTVTLVASNPKYSGTLTKTDYLTVIDPTKVEANFSCDVSATYSGGSIHFIDQSIGAAESWEWTFEGGSPGVSAQQNPTVTYSTPGRYKVKLRAYNSANSSVKETDKYVLVVPSDGLTAFFPFNGTLNDVGPFKGVSSLNVPTAVVTHNGTDRKNVSGNVAVFDGSGGLVLDNGKSFDFGTGDYSVSCWIRTSQKKQQMIWMEGGFGSGDLQTWLRLYSNASRNITLNIEKGGTIHVAPPNGDLAADAGWHHVVCTRNASGTKIYLDGMQIGSANTASGPGDTVNPNCPYFKIGVQQTATSWSNAFDGMLDDITVYKKELTLEEVQALFNL
ncbi:hypothetical protein AGMMS50239_23960 [Bacteroidia bacterium]|nr:hypothetical protein AGMMS50239_23960 [Bacteroidia bacterium]